MGTWRMDLKRGGIRSNKAPFRSADCCAEPLRTLNNAAANGRWLKLTP